MNPLNIPELLLHIFHFGSELDLDDDFGSPPPLPFGDSRPRFLKPFFRSIAQVNKNWRRTVLCVPSFWVTKVSFNWNSWKERSTGLMGTGVSYFSEQYDDAEEFLNDSNGSDLDFSIFCSHIIGSSPSDSESFRVLGEFSQWMDTHIFSACDRMRQFSFFCDEATLFEMISKRFLMCSWPKLRTMKLEVTGQIALVSGALNAPRLSVASFVNVEWIENKFELANSSISTLHVEHDAEVTSTDFELSTVMAYLTPSLLSSLTELKLMFWDDDQQERVLGDLPPSLPFARLKRMSLTLLTAENIWHLLKRTDAPLLTGLHLSTKYLTTSGIPSECFPQRFPLLEDMGFSFMTPPWTVVFMRLLPNQHSRLSTLSLDLHQMFREDDDISQGFDAIVCEKFFPHPIELPNLENLSLKLGTTDAWFFTTFNLEAAAGHLVLDYSCQETRLAKSGPLRFPNVTKVTVGHRKYLNHVATPAIRHLVFDFSNDRDSDDSFAVRFGRQRNPIFSDSPLIPRDSEIPLGKLEVLEIGWDSLSHLKHLAPFNEVHTLLISVKHIFPNHLPFIPEIIKEAKGFRRRASISEPVLPNLRTLGLCFKDPEHCHTSFEPRSNDHRELGLRIAQAFLGRRLDEGNPIQTLRIIGFLPNILQCGPEFTWLRDGSGAKIEFEEKG